MRTVVFCVTLLTGTIAVAQDHRHPPQDEKLHAEFYAKWKQPPGRGTSCCNQEDCYPTAIKLVEGVYWARRREDGEWVFVHPSKIEQNQSEDNIVESPDHNSHACMQKPGFNNVVFCATITSAQ